MKAVICPICNGRGNVEIQLMPSATNAQFNQRCHGCDGCGWVEVHD